METQISKLDLVVVALVFVCYLTIGIAMGLSQPRPETAKNPEVSCSLTGIEVKTVIVEDANGGRTVKQYEPYCLQEEPQNK